MKSLGVRRLNRTLLDRQLLLRRRRGPGLELVARLVGLQAQVPRDPYVALWGRIEGFAPGELAGAMLERRAVRLTLLRGTLHLVTAEDALRIRPVMQPVLERVLHRQSPFGRDLEGLDVAELTRFGAALLEERPRTRAQLAAPLTERWPDKDGASLAYALTYLLPLVQVTPRGVWGRTGPSAFTTVEHWLGRPLESSADPEPLILRYL
ncbi:MAG: DNA glycosylase AlkZ-like family protein, partial [Planctomycetaceae bacterium]